MFSKNTANYLLVIIVVTIIAFCALLWYIEAVYRYQNTNYTEVSAEAGLWDLRDIDFDTTIVSLQGNVEYIPNQILNPEQFAAQEELIEIGNPIDVNAGRTARLTVLMPDNGYYRLLTLGDYARTVYINGDLIGQFGVAAAEAADFKPGYGEIVVDIKATDNTFNLIVQGANFAHREGGQYNSTIIGKPALLNWFMHSQTIVESLAIGMLLLLCVFHLLLAIVSGSYRLNLLFSLTCFIYSLRLSLVGSKVIFEILPNLNWQLALKAEYICISLSALLILQIVDLQFDNIFNKKVLGFFKILLGLFSLVFVLVNTFTLSNLMVPLTVCYSVVIFYINIVIYNKFLHKSKSLMHLSIEQRITIISLLILFIAAVFDAFFFSGIYLLGIKSSLAEIAILMYSIGQTVAIFYISMRKAETALAAEQKAVSYAQNLESLNKMKSEFLQDMSHEMKTPLTVIATGVDYIAMQSQKEHLSADKINNALDIVKGETNKLGRMVSGMIDLETMMMTENRRKFDFGELLSTCASSLMILADEKNTQISCHISSDLPPVFADYQSLVMVINNILSNAIRHTQDGLITINAALSGQHIEVKIADNGCGIAPELIDKVMQRGVSYSGGMGLGLYISLTIINAHGGELAIASKENQGTMLTFRLPVYAGQEEGH